MDLKDLLDKLLNGELDSDVEIIIQHKRGDGDKGVQKISGNKISILNAYYNLSQTLVNNKVCSKNTLKKIIEDIVKED